MALMQCASSSPQALQWDAFYCTKMRVSKTVLPLDVAGVIRSKSDEIFSNLKHLVIVLDYVGFVH